MIGNLLHKFRFGVAVINLYQTWFNAFMDYFGILRKKNIVHRFRDGTQFEIRTGTNDFGIINEVYIVKEYHPLLRFVKPDSVVIDIGAQIGAFSVFASKRVRDGRVLSFEPFAENYRLLKKNILMNGLPNVELYERAIGGKVGMRELTISKDNTGGHSFYETGNQTVSVETTTLQEVFEKEHVSVCDYLKMDCEGAEFEILYNTPRRYLERIRAIAMEYHQEGGDVFVLKRFLEKAGFEVDLKTDVAQGMLYAWRE